MTKRYEVLWYVKEVNETEQEGLNKGDYQTLEFATKKQALNFYEKHKENNDKCGWWVTHRNAEWEVIEDIIY